MEGGVNFKASGGCLESVSERHQIVFIGSCDESSNVCEEIVIDQSAELQRV
jgi:hypothetical protein